MTQKKRPQRVTKDVFNHYAALPYSGRGLPDLEDFELSPATYDGNEFPDQQDSYNSPNYFYSVDDNDLMQEAVERYDEPI